MRGKILIVKAGSTFSGVAAAHGDFEDWVSAGLGAATGRVEVRCPPLGEPLPDSSKIAGVVITGSHADAIAADILLLGNGHAQSVIALPPGAALPASGVRDPHQAFRLGRRAWGVQFHPEFSAGIARAYVKAFARELRAEGQDPEALESAIRDTPESRELLRWFGELAS